MKLNRITKSIIIVFLTLSINPSAFAHDGHKDIALAPAAPVTESLFNLDSVWTNQDGMKISLSILKGQPAILAMIYTSCESACPLIVEDMKKIEKQLPLNTQKKVRFALFSFDSARDTTARLKKYAKDRGLGPSWILARGSDKSVRELAAALGVQYKKSASGDFQHSDVITLLDHEGVIKKQQTGLGNNGHDMAAATEQFIQK